MARISLTKQLAETGRVSNPRHAAEQSRTWFRQQAIKVRNLSVTKLLNEESKQMAKTIRVKDYGKMIMFFYDPKWKATLPYYDKFPLIFPLELYGDRFLGMNLHYLPPILRAKLMDALWTTASDRKYNDNTRLRISYEILKRSSRMRFFRPCVKEYLVDHVTSLYRIIPASEWDRVLLLPSERFEKETKSGVWARSVAKLD